MELRKSVRGDHQKKIVDFEDDEEEILRKKTKLSRSRGRNKLDFVDFENYGFGKRVRKKTVAYTNYKIESDSDEEYKTKRVKGKKVTKKVKKERIPKVKQE
mmetsp:Transcript_36284/g.32572  ORF Transcript_36284/g.32572 Transcript_36284/m.32572 type:complete len:101 (-) Transcript_36284:217-519(-)